MHIPVKSLPSGTRLSVASTTDNFFFNEWDIGACNALYSHYSGEDQSWQIWSMSVEYDALRRDTKAKPAAFNKLIIFRLFWFISHFRFLQ